MPEFILDTGTPETAEQYAKLDTFTRAYIEAAFFTECEIGTTRKTWDPERHSSLPGDATLAELAPETLARMVEDCQRFQDGINGCNSFAHARIKAPEEKFLDVVYGAESTGRKTDGLDFDALCVKAGHDFWYSRNGHGCGFWDGDWPEPYATVLDAFAKAFGEFSLYQGDDEKVYHL